MAKENNVKPNKEKSKSIWKQIQLEKQLETTHFLPSTLHSTTTTRVYPGQLYGV